MDGSCSDGVEKMEKATVDAWWVYILRCADGSLYTGITKDIARRVQQHNGGKGARYTRGRTPVVVAFEESQADHGSALKRELQIKALSRPAKEILVEGFKGKSKR